MKKLFTTFCLVMATIIMLGQEFSYEGINYAVINASQKICMTKSGSEISDGQDFYSNQYISANEVEGSLIVPANVTFAGITYTVVAIGTASFAHNNITSLVLPNTITEIGAGAFANCENLSDITFSENLKSINNGAFQYCTNLQKIIVPNSVKELGRFVFEGCSGLKSVKLSNSLTFLNHAVFRDCISLNDVDLPESITKLGDGEGGIGSCFENCESLKFIKLPTALTYIGWSVFEGCKSLESIYLPDSVTDMVYSVFQDCTNLKSIRLSNSLNSLYNMTFWGCENLEYIEIPSPIRSIGWRTFGDCRNLDKIILPRSLTSISDHAFTNCISLSEIECYAITPPEITSPAFENVFVSYVTLHVPQGTKSSYESAETWQNFGEIIDDLPSVSENEESFTNGDFKYKVLDKNAKTVSIVGLSNTKDIEGILTIPYNVSYLSESYTVVSIEDYAFYGLNMSGIEIPSSISNIGNWALANCNNLTSVKLPDSILEISNGLFSGCSSLEKIYFSNSVNYIGASAFSDCINLRSLIIPDGITEIPNSMLQGCTNISEVLIPNSVSLIGNYAFSGCTSLKNIDLGAELYYIGNYAFADCPNIQNIHSMALNPPNAEAYTFPNEAYTDATVTVQEQALTTYNSQNPWYRFQNYLTVSGAISLSHYNVDMAGNEVFQLGVYGSDSKIEWSSSNPSVAYANDCGLIVALGITGATVITANVDGENINCNVTVSSPYRDPNLNTRAEEDNDTQPVDVIIESISGNPPIINARLVPVGAKTIIDWTSSDNNIASVENGIVTIYSDGDVDFGVETENGLEETIEVDTKNIDDAGIETIFPDIDRWIPMNIYDLNGRIIYFNATLEQIKNLNKGIYIVKGKKILVK